MRLDAPLCRLPLRFDVGALTSEICTLTPDDWINHPGGNESSSNVILVSAGGTINDDFASAGAMRLTRTLKQRPYLCRLLSSFRAPIARARLTKLVATTRLGEHEDANFHWFRRVRVHVPIVTHPAVVFRCGGDSVHMAPGEAWLFDNFRNHSVWNDSREDRIHLIFDTRGSAWFWQLVKRSCRTKRGSTPMFVPATNGIVKVPRLESYRFDVPRPPEVHDLVSDIHNELALLPAADKNAMDAVSQGLSAFEAAWRQTFRTFGSDPSEEHRYRMALDDLREIAETTHLRRRLRRFGRAYGSLAVLMTVFQMTNRTVTHEGVKLLA